MIGAILIVVFMWMAMGSTATERNVASDIPAAPSAPAAKATGQEFMMYRNAVLAYAEANPSLGASGNYPIDNNALEYPGGVSALSLPNGAANLITPGPNGSRIIYVWMPAQAGAVAQTVEELGGDLSIGRIRGATWSTPALGTMGTIPSPGQMPSGDMISVVELGG